MRSWIPYIEKYAVGWKFERIPLVASAIMRVAMYEILYMPEIPNAAAINEAVEIAKKYEDEKGCCLSEWDSRQFCTAGVRGVSRNGIVCGI